MGRRGPEIWGPTLMLLHFDTWNAHRTQVTKTALALAVMALAEVTGQERLANRSPAAPGNKHRRHFAADPPAITTPGVGLCSNW